MIGSQVQIRSQVSLLQSQLQLALNTYATSGEPRALVTALKLQSQISNVLLGANSMSTPLSTAQLTQINGLR
ncbi:MAG: hypothetical protein ACREPM_18915 [Gemmatimonadaceae bacterium]